jgi:hypothetical protein
MSVTSHPAQNQHQHPSPAFVSDGAHQNAMKRRRKKGYVPVSERDGLRWYE